MKTFTGIATVMALVAVFTTPSYSAPQGSQATISGRVLDDAGRSLPGVIVTALDVTNLVNCYPYQATATTQSDGTFSLQVPRASYALSANTPPPLNEARGAVNATSGNVAGITLRATVGPLADSTPIASRITLSTPNADNQAIMAGQAGSVPASGFVFFTVLDTTHISVEQARPDGSFSHSIFAPPGSSIIVQADPLGRSVCGEGEIGAIPGTIIRVPDAAAAGEGIAVSGAGNVTCCNAALPAWTFQGTINKTRFVAGETFTVTGTVRIRVQAGASVQSLRLNPNIGLEMLSDAFGKPSLAHNTLSSVVLTPTGLPIERQTKDYAAPGGNAVAARTAPDALEATIAISFRIPNTLPEGLFRPVLRFFMDDLAPEQPPSHPLIVVDRVKRHGRNEAYLPVIQIGTPDPGRSFWTLLTDTPSNGSRGTAAIEDEACCAIASRIVTQSKTFIVPKTDAATGLAIPYRLEPFAPLISAGDRGVAPSVPTIPFRFPSGSLTVRIRKPDDAEQVIGPAPFVQSRTQALTDRNGGVFGGGGGTLNNVYQLTTLNPAFIVRFDQDGEHRITMEGSIDDIWGNTWTSRGTYVVHVARILSLDTAVLPGTPFETGDVLNAGMQIDPPVPADIQVTYQIAPDSDGAKAIKRTIFGRASRFGVFQPSEGIALDLKGEYRIDITASFQDEDGNLWMGSRSWGSVVAAPNPSIIAHGERGIEPQIGTGPQWFMRNQVNADPIPQTHVFFPFHSGDVEWLQRNDAAITAITFQDPAGTINSVLRNRAILTPPQFDARAAIGESPLYSSRADGLDLHFDPSKTDLWGYSYRSVQRPLVRVREQVAEDGAFSMYWRFREKYDGQIGTGRNGDLPNDFKFQFGGVVLRGSALGQPLYAIYGSLLVIVADPSDGRFQPDPGGGSRTFPPFQGKAGGPSGGPIVTLKGQPIDMFFHPTTIRAGSILEVGDRASFAGYVAPTLPSKVSITVIAPSGRARDISGQANRIGYFYKNSADFVIDEAGIYRVRVTVLHDGQTSAGPVSQPYPTGSVLGATQGEFKFYAVTRESPDLAVNLPSSRFVRPSDGAVDVAAVAPSGVQNPRMDFSTTMPGFILEEGAQSSLTYRYEAVRLNRDFPNLDLVDPNNYAGTDLISMTLFVSGTDADGQRTYRARRISLMGDELLAPVFGTRRYSLTGRGGTTVTTQGESSATLEVGYAQVQNETANGTPGGVAIFGYRQNGILVSEAGVPGTSPVLSGRLFAEVNSSVNTGLAIANPNSEPAIVDFYFTGSTSSAQGRTTVPANGQIAKFLNEAPFSPPSSFSGTFTFTSSRPVAVTALRGLTNERGDFLLTTLPVAPTSSTETAPQVLSHFADGGGWATQVALVNPTDATLSGTLQFFEQDGRAEAPITYQLAPRASDVFRTAGTTVTVRTGYIRVVPAAGGRSPSGVGIFSYRSNGVTVSETGVAAIPNATAFRMYAEASGVRGAAGSIETGIAVANSSASPLTVTLEITSLAGQTLSTGTISVPANSQTAKFLTEIPQFATLPSPLQGILRISTNSPAGIGIVGLRGRVNERGDFLIATTPPLSESAPPATDLLFPHFALGGGYTTQFILFSTTGSASTGGLRFVRQSGRSMNLTFR